MPCGYGTGGGGRTLGGSGGGGGRAAGGGGLFGCPHRDCRLASFVTDVMVDPDAMVELDERAVACIARGFFLKAFNNVSIEVYVLAPNEKPPGVIPIK